MSTPWYKTGTISVPNGSTAVTGSGTAWVANSAPGEALQGPDGKLYEIAAINSDTSLTLAAAYLGSTVSGQAYTILPSQSYIRDLAAQAAALVNAYSSVVTGAGAGKFGDGTVDAPGVSFVADTNTGIRRVGSDSFALVTGGADRGVLSNSGLSLSGLLSATALDATPIGATTRSTGAFTTLSASGNLSTGGTTSDSGRNITVNGTGTTASTAPYFTVNCTALAGSAGTVFPAGGLLFSAYRDVRNPAYAAGITLNVYNSSNAQALASALIFRISGVSNDNFASLGDSALPSEVARIDNSGNLMVGDTTTGQTNTNSWKFQPSNGYGFYNHNSSIPGGTAYTYFSYGGTIIGSITQNGTTAVAYNTTSDHRLKTNVRPANAARFMDIEFVDFEWVDGRHGCGVIADQLQSVYPDIVIGEKDATEVRTVEITPAVPEVKDEEGNVIAEAVPAVTEEQTFPVYQQVNYMGLIGRMGTVIQQQQRAIESLTARLTAAGIA